MCKNKAFSYSDLWVIFFLECFQSHIVAVVALFLFFRRAINGNNWSTWFIHRKRFYNKSYVCCSELSWATCIHLLESQQRCEYCNGAKLPFLLPITCCNFVVNVDLKNSKAEKRTNEAHQRSWQNAMAHISPS